MKAYPTTWRGPRRRTWRLIARYAVAVAVTLLFLFPVYWLFMIAF